MDKIISAYKEFTVRSHDLLPLSANVDVILFLLGLKTCLRTKAKKLCDNCILIRDWCTQFHYSFDIDAEGFVYIAANDLLLTQLKNMDCSSKPHEVQLGKLLGYPECCCEKAAEIGETEIDNFEKKLINQMFAGSFKLIDPSAYTQGKAFISHVPCSSRCLNSLAQAQKFVQFLVEHKDKKVFFPWLEELKKHFKGSL